LISHKKLTPPLAPLSLIKRGEGVSFLLIARLKKQIDRCFKNAHPLFKGNRPQMLIRSLSSGTEEQPWGYYNTYFPRQVLGLQALPSSLNLPGK
jgi:hypothetical protein